MINTINNILKEQHITIRELAIKCNMPYSNVYNILHGKNIPRIDTIEKILSVIGCRIQVIPIHDQTVEYYKKAALESRNCSEQWFRYLRKIVSEDGCKLSELQINMLLSSSSLTMYQKLLLKRAIIPETETNLKVLGLNRKTKVPMIEEIRRKYNVKR